MGAVFIFTFLCQFTGKKLAFKHCVMLESKKMPIKMSIYLSTESGLIYFKSGGTAS